MYTLSAYLSLRTRGHNGSDILKWSADAEPNGKMHQIFGNIFWGSQNGLAVYINNDIFD
jgi:hypothetical protein